MRLAAIPARHRMSALALLLSLFHSSCAQPTTEEWGRAVLEEAAEAMGGLEALEGIENITRKGSLQANSLGQAHLASEPLSIRPSRPYTQIIDFAGSRQVSLTGQPATAQVANLEKGGYRDVRGVALRPMASSLLLRYKKEWDRDIAKFLVHVLGEQGRVEGVEEAVLEGRSHQVVHVWHPDGIAYQIYVDGSTHLISRLDFTEDLEPFGDVKKERSSSDYRQVDGVRLPFSGVNRVMGQEIEVYQWSEITVNSELPEERFEIPEEIREQAQAQVHAETVVKPTKLAEGVYFGEGLSTNNMWVEFEDFVLVVEGPGGEQHSLEVMRQILGTVGDKPIRLSGHHPPPRRSHWRHPHLRRRRGYRFDPRQERENHLGDAHRSPHAQTRPVG